MHKRTRIHRGGNPNVRGALYLPAVTASHMGNNGLARTYQHLVEKNGLCKQAALVAVMRKTVVLMRALIINQTPYDDAYARG